METTGELHGFRGLRVWQKSFELALATWALSKRFPKAEMGGLTRDLRDAAGMVPAHIAAGNAHPQRREYLRHLAAAHGSLYRAITALLLAERLGLVSEGEIAPSLSLADEVGRMLRALMRALQPPQVTFVADPAQHASEPADDESTG
jgi:four helix bundle protein